jgi:hypothetical protein
MNRHFRAVLVGPLLLGTFVAACGDDDGASETDFREQASVILCEGDQEIGAAIGEVFGGGEPTPEQMTDALATIVAASRAQADGIEALAVPSGMADDVEALLVEWRSAATMAEGQGLGYFESDDDPWAETAALAEDLGLESCGGE